MKKLVSLALTLALCAVFVPQLPARAAQEVVNVYNWYDYMDEEVFEIFEQETGIHVNKMYFTTNEDMMVQVRVSPGAYDLVFPSDYCVERMIAENMLAEINFDNVPNLVNIGAAIKKLRWQRFKNNGIRGYYLKLKKES